MYKNYIQKIGTSYLDAAQC